MITIPDSDWESIVSLIRGSIPYFKESKVIPSCHIAPIEPGHPGGCHIRTLWEACPQSAQFSFPFVEAQALLYLFHRKPGTMPEKDFYLLIILCVVTGFLLIQIAMTWIGRSRKSRRLEREIAEHLRKRAARHNN